MRPSKSKRFEEVVNQEIIKRRLNVDARHI